MYAADSLIGAVGRHNDKLRRNTDDPSPDEIREAGFAIHDFLDGLRSSFPHLLDFDPFGFAELREIADNYDSTGQVYRVVLNLPISLYETPGHHTTDEYVTYDLATGLYAHQTDPTDKGGWAVTEMKPEE